MKYKKADEVDVDDLADWDSMGDDLADALMPSYEQLFQFAYDSVGNVTGKALDFDLTNPAIKKTLGDIATRVKSVTDTTRDEIRGLVDQATQEGWSTAKLAKAIRDQGTVSSETRSAAIARTESATAYSQGSLLAYKDAGVVKKQWLASDDGCDDCQEMDGETADVDEDFSGGVGAPPLHPNCTCAVSPVVE